MNFARIMEADVGLTECTERNVVQFLAAVCGKERCVTTEYKKKKKNLHRKLSENSLWRLFGSLVLLEFCSKRN